MKNVPNLINFDISSFLRLMNKSGGLYRGEVVLEVSNFYVNP